ncbi:MAG: hypothetical protein IT423_08060 [Pirellulaceae bacterium]|nr:hypothetical protein [Pirellulaceae bacterium]
MPSIQPPSLPHQVSAHITRRRLLQGVGGTGLLGLTGRSHAQVTIRVGPDFPIQTIAAAASLAKDGAVIEVQAGDYRGDVAVWTRNDVTVRAVGGRVRLMADGAAAEGKAIWVTRGERMTVEGFDFSRARVPDRNGAGIRLEKGSLTVRDCTFTDNENGLLTSNNPQIVLVIFNSEFGRNGHGDGQSHNLYIGAIASLSMSGCYSHHAKVGHLLKSRAAINDIRYNRLTDESGGRASYELEFANGGVAYVVGNILEQGSQTENPHIVSYGAEGYTQPVNELYMVNNTLVDNRPRGGVFLRIKSGAARVKAVNNLLVGTGTLESAGVGNYDNNFTVDWDQFVFAARDDYRLRRSSPLLGKAIDAGMADGHSLMPDREYRHLRSTARIQMPAHHPGALQSVG